jgi:hypothetical protein
LLGIIEQVTVGLEEALPRLGLAIDDRADAPDRIPWADTIDGSAALRAGKQRLTVMQLMLGCADARSQLWIVDALSPAYEPLEGLGLLLRLVANLFCGDGAAFRDRQACTQLVELGLEPLFCLGVALIGGPQSFDVGLTLGELLLQVLDPGLDTPEPILVLELSQFIRAFSFISQ